MDRKRRPPFFREEPLSNRERVISDSERFVPIGVPKVDVEAEARKAGQTSLKNLPKGRGLLEREINDLKTDRGRIDLDRLPGRPLRGPITLHAELQLRLKDEYRDTFLADDGTDDFRKIKFPKTFDPQGYRRDGRGRPYLPDHILEQFLKLAYVDQDFRYYPSYGPNHAVDGVFAVEIGDRWKIVAIKRRDLTVRGVPEEKVVALPGGGIKKSDRNLIEACLREGYEEAFDPKGFDLRKSMNKVDFRLVYQGVVIGDSRCKQLTSWPESSVMLVVLDKDTFSKMRFRKDEQNVDEATLTEADDARGALLLDLSDADNLAFSHLRFTRLAFDVLQRKGLRHGFAIAKDGRSGKPQTPIAGDQMIEELAGQKLYGKNRDAAYIAFCAVEYEASRHQLHLPAAVERVRDEIRNHWMEKNPGKYATTQQENQFLDQAGAAVKMYKEEFYL